MKELVRITPENAKVFRPLIKDSAYPYIIDKTTVGIGIADDGVPFSAIVFRIIDEGTCEILSLFVRTAYRRQGYGTELLITMADFLESQTDVTKVICSYDLRQGLESGLNEFLGEMEFDVAQAPGGCYLTTVGDLRQISELEGGAGSCVPFSNLTVRQKKMLYNEDLDIKEELDRGLVEEKLSCAHFDGDDMDGCVVFTRDEEDPGALTLLWARNSGNPTETILMLRYAVSAAAAYSDDTKLYIPIISEKSDRLVNGLLKDRAEKIETSWQAEFELFGDYTEAG